MYLQRKTYIMCLKYLFWKGVKCPFSLISVPHKNVFNIFYLKKSKAMETSVLPQIMRNTIHFITLSCHLKFRSTLFV